MLLMYWKIRGLKTPINYCLEYAGEDYEEELFELVKDADGGYNFGSSYADSKWGAELKPKSKCDFPNIPCLIDDKNDVKLTQMAAIMGYIARKNKVLIPTTDGEAAQMDMINGVLQDWRMALFKPCYMPAGENALDDYRNGGADAMFVKNLPEWRSKFERFLGKHDYCAGKTLTYADFNLFEVLDVHLELCPGCFDDDKNIMAFHKKISEIPQIKTYRESDRFFKRPCNNLSAKYK